MNLKTCVHPSGNFIYGIHKPNFDVRNLREDNSVNTLGMDQHLIPVDNQDNFPSGSVSVHDADWVFEIPNAFAFRGATYIAKSWADHKAEKPVLINLPPPPEVSVSQYLKNMLGEKTHKAAALEEMLAAMPEPLQLATAVNTTDPHDLVGLARICCRFVFDETGTHSTGTHPIGLSFVTRPDGRKTPVIHNKPLFEAVANNYHLPDTYKKVMVLTPGVQGTSEIVGEYRDGQGQTHVFEYLRKNSYIPWGHYAANMADDAVRYRSADLTLADLKGMRHLYYQRTYFRMADRLGLLKDTAQGRFDEDQLENLRLKIGKALFENSGASEQTFNRTLWGWNFGFDYAPSKYRLHASHQQVHQQYALLPRTFEIVNSTEPGDGLLTCYGFGDLVEDFIRAYQEQTKKHFFDCYIQALRNNRRMDGNPERPSDLIVYEDDRVILFIPKAQTSQWELQLMTTAPVGNILEADTATRTAIDRAIFYAVHTLGTMGARMITGIEISKRFDAPKLDQRLIYCFLPRLPESPGAFSETQLRWINGHYPEDFAAVCRNHLRDNH